MIFNYHTHTYRCHHAVGEDREYIEKAIEGGVKKLGFSEHIPFAFHNGTEERYRMFFSDCEEYISAFVKYKEEYRDEIDIKIGFEAEYYPKYFESMLKYSVNIGAEYLILGQHSLATDFKYCDYCGFPSDNSDHFTAYTDCVIEGAKSGAFTYIAHPDLFYFTGDSDIFKRETTRLCKTAKEIGIPLEINLVGIRMNRNYPNKDFWNIAGEIGCNAVIGFDAHMPDHVCDVASIEKARRLADECGVVLLQDLDIKDITKLQL